MDNRKKNPELGLFIYRIINNSGKTQQEIADALNVDLRSIGYYCSGERKPNQIKLLKLLKITGANTQEIPF